jgi:hypothetical protein
MRSTRTVSPAATNPVTAIVTSPVLFDAIVRGEPDPSVAAESEPAALARAQKTGSQNFVSGEKFMVIEWRVAKESGAHWQHASPPSPRFDSFNPHFVAWVEV